MRKCKRILAVAVLAPFLAIAGYASFIWATYLGETVVSGAAYGFTIGASMEEALGTARNLLDHPQAVVYVSYGQRAGDHFTIAPAKAKIGQLRADDQWEVLLDGRDRFFSSFQLSFRDGKLVEIHGRRQYFELP